MSTDTNVPEDVNEEVTDTVVEKQEMSIDALKSLRTKSRENLERVDIPGTDFYVMIAAPDVNAMYKISSIMVEANDNTNAAANDALIMACVVSPKIDEAMLDELKACPFNTYITILTACAKHSPSAATGDNMENFT
jgi:hypothetical protein